MIDLMLSPAASAVLAKAVPGRMGGPLPPSISGTTTPSFMAILTLREASRFTGIDVAKLPEIDSELRALPVTEADKIARCVRFDNEVPVFNLAKGKEALAFYGQEYLQQAAALDLNKEQSSYQQALKNSRALAEQHLDQYLKQAQADLILIPTYGPSWPIDHVKGDSFNFGTSTAAAVAGYPNLSLPAGFDSDLPLGLSLIGLPWSEQKIISAAAFLEQKLQGRKAPQYLITAR